MNMRRCLANRFCSGVAIVFVFFVFPVFFCPDGEAAFFEKHYAVMDVQGEEVLCDPYRVRKGDWVIKILRQRGEIAYEDFPRFLEMFKILNPGVEDIDKIYPGQEVLIPLRILAPGAFEGQASGIVTLPVITITNLPDVLEDYSTRYTVQYGDSVSRLIARRFGEVGSRSYNRGVELFQKLNPEVDNIDFILAGQTLTLPNPEVMDTPAYQEYFDTKEQIIDLTAFSPLAADMPRAAEARAPTAEAVVPDAPEEPDASPAESVTATRPVETPTDLTLPLADPARGFSDRSVFDRAAHILEADIVSSGAFYFPRSGQSDLRLDLSETPLMVFKDGTTILFTKRQWLPGEDRRVLERFRPDMKIVFFEADSNLRTLVDTIVPIIDADGFERQINLNRDGIAVALRGQYIFNPPGSSQTVCLSIIEGPEMRIPWVIRDYIAPMGVDVRDWIEGEAVSGWAKDIAPESRRAPEITQLQAYPPERFVKTLFRALDCRYHEDVDVSFPYAGFQVNAKADLLSLGNGRDILIDYGDLGGGAAAAIEKTGIRVLQLDRSSDPQEMIAQLTDHLPLDVSADPIFWAASRPRLYNPSIQVPGYLVSISEAAASGGETPGGGPGIRAETAEGPKVGRDSNPGIDITRDIRDETAEGPKDEAHAPRLLVSMVPLPDAVAVFLVESGIRAAVVAGR